ncbi:MAG TPA: ROK family protein [Myxococcales bacterium]|nr:ROK family protein [Myxococcales bacterium]
MKHFVGIDVGGTRIKAGLVNAHFQVLNEEVIWLEDADKSEHAVLARIVEAVDAVNNTQAVESVGVGIAGCIDARRGIVVTSPNFPAWNNFDVVGRLKKHVSVPILVDNDAHCVIGGEYLAGAAVDCPDLLGFTLGTGVGGAIFLDGRLWRGIRGMAGEFGHITVEPGGPLCGCGSYGCLEMYCSRVGFEYLCSRDPVEGTDKQSPHLPQQLAHAAQSGNVTALAHFNTAGTMLGRTIAGLLNSLNVNNIVLAGGVSHTFNWMKDAMWTELRKRCYPVVADAVTVRLGTLGDKAGIIGAAMQWRLQD